MAEKPFWSIGSQWCRWDPHVHTPGTLRNDQFDGDWDGYVKAIESAKPNVAVLGVTDYFCFRGYRALKARQDAGALKGILLFPNLELRLTIETEKKKPINLHLLVSPDDPDHLARIEEKIAALTFAYKDEPYPCTEQGLIRLGRAYTGDPHLPDGAALKQGANQFKVEFSKLEQLKRGDGWVRRNVLFGVAAGNDGLSGLSKDSGFFAQREELARFADVIFSGQQGDREFWLGNHPDFAKRGYTPKPCIHGSDCHAIKDVLVPEQDRVCWIRAEPSFEGLRQAIVEPEKRTWIGPHPPVLPSASETIAAVRTSGAPWFTAKELRLNNGLVTVIGAKGSGKTALADLVALGANALDAKPGPASFVGKAGELLKGTNVELEWADSSLSTGEYGVDAAGLEPRVRYLSQQFVEQLCSPTGLGRPLLEEMERIVFNAIPHRERLEALTFQELREIHQAHLVTERESAREVIRAATERITAEREAQKAAKDLRLRLDEVVRQRDAMQKDLEAIPAKGSAETKKAYDAVSAEMLRLQDALAKIGRQQQQVKDLATEIASFEHLARRTHDGWKLRFGALLPESAWAALFPVVPAAGKEKLKVRADELEKEQQKLQDDGLLGGGAGAALGADAKRGLKLLGAEHKELAGAMGLDHANEKKRADLVKKLEALRTSEARLRLELEKVEKSPERLKHAQQERLEAYALFVSSLSREAEVLEKLYAPLRERLKSEKGLEKLSFFVRRAVRTRDWAQRGEELLDLRRKDPFRGSGLAKTAIAELEPVWRNGNPQEARVALDGFIQKYGSAAIEVLANGVTLRDFAEWLFSTDHISIEYGLLYEGVELERLSPGTRGVVLLMLYLALDDWDFRPLVIDQPEENLDPKSVQEQLVGFFRTATQRRQIIMVTHNANLVVNSDSDQVVIAHGERSSPVGLPSMSYMAGGLEHRHIRDAVCQLLEGGEAAFSRRGLRYGIRRPSA